MSANALSTRLTQDAQVMPSMDSTVCWNSEAAASDTLMAFSTSLFRRQLSTEAGTLDGRDQDFRSCGAVDFSAAAVEINVGEHRSGHPRQDAFDRIGAAAAESCLKSPTLRAGHFCCSARS